MMVVIIVNFLKTDEVSMFTWGGRFKLLASLTMDEVSCNSSNIIM